jgi:ribosomal protein S27AE
MAGSATIDARPNVCPKCGGTLIEDFDGDRECLQCGFIVYARVPKDVDPAKRERPPTHQGIRI